MTIKLRLGKNSWFYATTEQLSIHRFTQTEWEKVRCDFPNQKEIFCDGICEPITQQPINTIIKMDNGTLVIYDCSGYILNDKGQTIEVI